MLEGRDRRSLSGQEMTLKPITTELSDWLLKQLGVAGVPVAKLEGATVTLSYRTDRLPTDRSKIVVFDLEATTSVLAAERFSFGTAEGTQWHTRNAA